MSEQQFEQIASVIRNRRSVSWSKMNGQIISRETIDRLLELADWAPTHGKTEPWRFFVYSGKSLKDFGKAHADL